MQSNPKNQHAHANGYMKIKKHPEVANANWTLRTKEDWPIKSGFYASSYSTIKSIEQHVRCGNLKVVNCKPAPLHYWFPLWWFYSLQSNNLFYSRQYYYWFTGKELWRKYNFKSEWSLRLNSVILFDFTDITNSNAMTPMTTTSMTAVM